MINNIKISIVISNRNDLEMLAITVRSCIEALIPIPESEIVICDNSDKAYWEMLPSILPEQYKRDKKIRIVRQNFPCLFTAREAAIRAAKGKYVFCLDSHMLIGYNTFIDSLNFMERHGDIVGFGHAPLCARLHQHEDRSKHDRIIDKHELGSWGFLRKEEQKITWKGMPWICRRDWFLNELNGYGALSQHALAWGGGDMHIGTKPWLLGYQNWAIPCRPCIHIGPFPKPKELTVLTGYKYRVYSKSGNNTNTLGFLVASYVLGGEPMMKRNAPTLKERFGLDIDGKWQEAIEYGKDERQWLLENQIISYEEYLKNKPWTK